MHAEDPHPEQSVSLMASAGCLCGTGTGTGIGPRGYSCCTVHSSQQTLWFPARLCELLPSTEGGGWHCWKGAWASSAAATDSEVSHFAGVCRICPKGQRSYTVSAAAKGQICAVGERAALEAEVILVVESRRQGICPFSGALYLQACRLFPASFLHDGKCKSSLNFT